MIYFDHASTSFKKPEEVSTSIYQALVNGIGNPGRGANEISMSSARILQNGRNAVCRILEGLSPEQVIFKGSLTDALNTLLIGLLKEGDHVISSVMEHNSVLRPLEHLKQNKIIEYDLLPCDENGKILIQDISRLERPNTKAVILSQVSNLTGIIQPIGEIRNLLINKDVFIIIDTAQSAGYIKVNYQDLNIDGLAFTGHKGLLGPQGVGGFLLNERLNKAMEPVFTGGTGSDSLSLSQPDFLPDKFEAGTQNLLGILGLTKGIEYIENMCSI
ncbi:MAG: aminotransferase class V-fold PLP-dependent enzyme, partial [Clostridium sp.]|nr:aminotransferase class V-fold PLP-dependent enzyme [Clostridium sp.]